MSLDNFLFAVNAALWPLSFIIWATSRREKRFLANMTPVLWEAADKLEEWQKQGLVAFVNEDPLERARHLWKLCDYKDKEDVQHCFRMIAGPHGFAMYNVMLARRRFWQVL